jgi:hypothetical protein
LAGMLQNSLKISSKYHILDCEFNSNYDYCMHVCRAPIARPKHSVPTQPSTSSSEGKSVADTNGDFLYHPDFPSLPASVPLTYTLMMVACLSEKPGDRPNFDQVVTVLRDIQDEVSSGCYLDSDGVPQVRMRCRSNVCKV